MKCQTCLWEKNKKYVINLSFAELAQRMVKVKLDPDSDTVLSLHYFVGLSITIAFTKIF